MVSKNDIGDNCGSGGGIALVIALSVTRNPAGPRRGCGAWDYPWKAATGHGAVEDLADMIRFHSPAQGRMVTTSMISASAIVIEVEHWFVLAIVCALMVQEPQQRRVGQRLKVPMRSTKLVCGR